MSVDQKSKRRLAFEATHLTSTTTLRRAIRDPAQGAGHPLGGMRAAGIVTPDQTIELALAEVSSWMLGNYRNESVYKNAIANRIFLERHKWGSASMLSEFRVRESIADCVVINGRACVYEIKTELDNPAKLLRQLRDYHRVFRFVTVVTYRSLAKIYTALLTEMPVGLITLNDDGTFHTQRRSPVHDRDLAVDDMMRSLRKPEYTKIAEKILGSPVSFPATQHFARCIEIARRVTPLEYSSLLEDVLRDRKPRVGQAITEERFASLRHQLLKVDPSEAQLANVAAWMTGRI